MFGYLEKKKMYFLLEFIIFLGYCIFFVCSNVVLYVLSVYNFFFCVRYFIFFLNMVNISIFLFYNRC